MTGLSKLAAVKVFQSERKFRTSGGLHVTDITDEVKAIVYTITGEMNAYMPDLLAPQSRTRKKYIVVEINDPGTSK